MNNAIIMTAIYDNLSWQKKTIKLWREYADNIGVDFILAIDKGDIIPPNGYFPIYKLRSVEMISQSDYDSVLFVDCDTIVNVNYSGEVFKKHSDDPLLVLNNKFLTREEVPYQEDYVLWYSNGIRRLGVSSGEMREVSTSVFLANPKFCSVFVSTLKEHGFWPNNREVEEKIVESIYSLNICDQFFWSIFFSLSDIEPITPYWPYSFYPDGSDFVMDLWNSKNNAEQIVERLL
jgi:hypothetical protein